ncbi:HAMP domain-containing histidine kinase [Petralouisia muris]|uniref:HAMP domain-containing histidine kinase n=1 Tax=Petralouisia muris TaxID=3032872 RepID=A0AC61RVA7_9FIRM|nr:HAMP domain-containing sensor histidine kinase [Petralouisia muris]TGY95551.1 HAMP domain-containing histidine kinase [Petralouisia muris]
MTKIRYSAGLKIIAVAANLVFSVILVLSVMMLVVLFQKDILDFGDLKNKSFESSSAFFSKFQESEEEILNFIDLRKKFETDGSYDSEKEVGIWDYYASREIPGRMGKSKDGNRLQYYLGDLSEWSRGYQKAEYEFVSEYTIDQRIRLKQNVYKDGVSILSEEKTVSTLEEMTTELQEIIVQNVEHYYGGSYSISVVQEGKTYSETTVFPEDEKAYSEDDLPEDEKAYSEDDLPEDEKMEKMIQKVRNGKLYELKGDELILLLGSMDMMNLNTVVSYEFVEEDYLPVNGVGIWENFMKGEYTMNRMCNAYAALEYTLANIGEEISKYKRCLNLYNLSENGTNVSYWISRGNEDTIYTNIKEPLNIGFAEYGEKKGKYVYYRENDIRLETNVKGMEDVFYSFLEPKYGGKGNVLFVCVDTAFPNEDEFKRARDEFTGMRPWIYISLLGAALSLVICLICLIYLSMAAGRREEEEKIYLNLFDQIPTEVLYFLVVSAGSTCFLLFGRIFYQFSSEELTGLMLASGILSFFSGTVFLSFYLSFVRRIRAGVLWKRSILYWFVHGIGLLFLTRKSSAKMLILFGMHLLFCFALWSGILSNMYDEEVIMLILAGFILLSCVEAVLIIREGVQRNKVLEGIRKISGGDLEYKIAAEELSGDNKCVAEAVNTIGDGLFHAVDDSMRNEHLKADLITNVSHDIKTPLTSIINYVDLLKREDLQNERVQGYIAVLDSKSQRLKQLTEDLVEASKVSSGNIKLEMERINLVELVHQTEGEFDERFQVRNLTVVSKLPRKPVIILADGRRIWRVLENLYSNVAKYAMEHTRVYVDMEADGNRVRFSVKNISENPLNIHAEELTERFIRGDISRSTEGSGLGLSIAKSLTELMNGTFEIYLDGDLFKATVSFPQEPEILKLPDGTGV